MMMPSRVIDKIPHISIQGCWCLTGSQGLGGPLRWFTSWWFVFLRYPFEPLTFDVDARVRRSSSDAKLSLWISTCTRSLIYLTVTIFSCDVLPILFDLFSYDSPWYLGNVSAYRLENLVFGDELRTAPSLWIEQSSYAYFIVRWKLKKYEEIVRIIAASNRLCREIHVQSSQDDSSLGRPTIIYKFSSALLHFLQFPFSITKIESGTGIWDRNTWRNS